MMDEMDEIWSLFSDDGRQALEAMEDALGALKGLGAGQPTPMEPISALFRAVHTFKGNSRVLGLGVIESRAHLAEDLIGLVRDKGATLDSDLVDILYLAMDTFAQMLDAVDATRADVDPALSEGLMERMRARFAQIEAALSGAEPSPASPAALPEPEPLPEPAPEPLPDPDPTPEPASAQPAPPPPAVETAQPRNALEDAGYREIFAGMVRESTEAMRNARAADDAQALTQAVTSLARAARRMGLSDWQGALDAFKAGPGDAAALDALLARLDDLAQRDLGGGLEQPDAAPDAADLAEVLETLTHLADTARAGALPSAEDRAGWAHRLSAVLSGQRQGRARRGAQALAVAADGTAFDAAIVSLLRDLANGEPEGGPIRDLLGRWSAASATDSLTEILLALVALRADATSISGFERLTQNMYRVYHACVHYGLESPGRLTLALVDLFERVNSTQRGADPILLRIARTYVEAMETVLAAANRGENPDTARIEELLGEAETTAFASLGVVSAQAIERRLGLPAGFHRVLSPENVRTTTQALEAGKRFYILRADINDDVALAEAFMDWIAQPDVTLITNVTVFDGARTLFDFLIASAADQTAVAARLGQMDPGGRLLHLTHTLADGPDEDASEAQEQGSTGEMPLSLAAVEAIGEVSAAQSTVQQMSAELAEHDLGAELRRAMQAEGLSASAIQRILGSVWQPFQERLQGVVHAEALVGGQLNALQDAVVRQRERPVASVMRALSLMVRAATERRGARLVFTTTGDDQMLDSDLLDAVRRVMRVVLGRRLADPDPLPDRLHLSVQCQQERVLLVLDDPLSAPFAGQGLAQIMAEVRRHSGQVQQIALPQGGTRLHVALPRSMVVLEGMVVGVGSVRYVVPIQAVSRVMTSDAGRFTTIAGTPARRVLRLDDNTMATVAALPRGRAAESGSGRAREGLFLILRAGERHFALPVDTLLGQQLVLLRPLRGVMAGLRHLSGVALLAGGEVGMVVSVSALAELTGTEGADAA